MNKLTKCLAAAACLATTTACAGMDQNMKTAQSQGEMPDMKAQKAMEKPSASSHAWVEQHLKGWPEKNKEVAAKTIDKHGPPQEVTGSMLVWHDNAPWKRTILYKEQVQHNFPVPHKDMLEQFVDFEVPEDMADELAHFDGSVYLDRTKGEISARCDKEAANLLALNLAHDITTGKLTVDEARSQYGEAMKMMMTEGKMHPYMKSLAFQVPPSGNDPDHAIIEKPQKGVGGAGDEGMHEDRKHPKH